MKFMGARKGSLRVALAQASQKDAGLQLHYITGTPASSCYRYTSGERPLPSELLRILLHSDHGQPFLLALMDGCKAKWWLEFERQRCVGAQVLEITKLD